MDFYWLNFPHVNFFIKLKLKPTDFIVMITYYEEVVDIKYKDYHFILNFGVV